MNPELSKIQSSNIVLSPLISKALKNKPIKPLGERKKAVLRQECMVLLGNACVVLSGMAAALPSATLPQLTDPNDIYHFNTAESGWFASIHSVAGPFGGLIIGYLMDRLGRKCSLLLTNVVGIIAWTLMLTASYHNSKHSIYAQLLLGRFLSGILSGAAMTPIGSYSAEISLPSIRGRLILASSILMSLGILLMYILGFLIRGNIQLICLITLIGQCIAFICVLPMPESPSWLLLRGKTEKARKSLKYFRGLAKKDTRTYDEFETELALMKKASDQSHTAAENESLMQTLRSPDVYKPLSIMIGFFFFQQFSGLPIVIVFAAQIVESTGISLDPMLIAVFVGVARLITTFFMSTMFERWGRRPAGMLSAGGMSVCMLVLAASCQWPFIRERVPLLAVFAIILHIIFTTLGLLPLPFLMISEVFPQRVRGSANGLTLFVGLGFSFAVVKLYPTVESLIGTAYTFAFFGLTILTGMLYIWLFVPETKGRTLLEIENYFRTGRRVTNAQVFRRESLIAMQVSKGVFSSQTDLEEVLMRLSNVNEDGVVSERDLLEKGLALC
ncbi:facilitated trehalose transporter Tret1-2 homolog [Eurosta solidaginis]|uniref:facilitated trehalose transporter Tret1-2 homolog n=1 Tax=Eurosta solidaginis TaxID=178769 RepID=UPI00353148F5